MTGMKNEINTHDRKAKTLTYCTKILQAPNVPPTKPEEQQKRFLFYHRRSSIDRILFPCFTVCLTFAPCGPSSPGYPPHACRKVVNISSRLLERKTLFEYYIATPGAPSETLSERLMRSCARHLLVAASSRRTEEKVASRRGSGRH